MDRLRMYYLLIHKDTPAKWSDLKKFSILKSDNSLSKLLGHLINDNYIDKPNMTYIITDEGRKDYEALLKSLNCYVMLLIRNHLSTFPDCPELQFYLKKCESFDSDFYEDAIIKFDEVDDYLIARARTISREENISLEKAFRNIYYAIEEVLNELVGEFCGKR